MLFPGQTPAVRVGGQPAALRSSPAPTDQALTVSLPTDLDAGPQADVRVTLNGRTSVPLTFSVTPWLARLTPTRTALPPAAADRKLVLSGSGFTTAPKEVRLAGPGSPAPIAAFDPGGSDTRATVTLPGDLANGLYNVRIVRADDSASNARPLEVLPRVDPPVQVTVVSVSGSNVHRLTVNGARLNGSDVRLVLDGVSHGVGVNGNANQLVLTLGRLLTTGTHRVSVLVNGQASHTVDLEV
jgi:hypothetical protein